MVAEIGLTSIDKVFQCVLMYKCICISHTTEQLLHKLVERDEISYDVQLNCISCFSQPEIVFHLAYSRQTIHPIHLPASNGRAAIHPLSNYVLYFLYTSIRHCRVASQEPRFLSTASKVLFLDGFLENRNIKKGEILI
jgi:hypothetical protein